MTPPALSSRAQPLVAPSRVPFGLLSEIVREAQRHHPIEACGFVLADPSGGEYLLPGENVQQHLHAEDSSRWPRPATMAYVIAPHSVVAMLGRVARGHRLLAIYHSHTMAEEAHFSEEDVRGSAGLRRQFPSAEWLVLSLTTAVGPWCAKSYRLDSGAAICLWAAYGVAR